MHSISIILTSCQVEEILYSPDNTTSRKSNSPRTSTYVTLNHHSNHVVINSLMGTQAKDQLNQKPK